MGGAFRKAWFEGAGVPGGKLDGASGRRGQRGRSCERRGLRGGAGGGVVGGEGAAERRGQRVFFREAWSAGGASGSVVNGAGLPGACSEGAGVPGANGAGLPVRRGQRGRGRGPD